MEIPNLAVPRETFAFPPIQTKLTIGQAEDKNEQIVQRDRDIQTIEELGEAGVVTKFLGSQKKADLEMHSRVTNFTGNLRNAPKKID